MFKDQVKLQHFLKRLALWWWLLGGQAQDASRAVLGIALGSKCRIRVPPREFLGEREGGSACLRRGLRSPAGVCAFGLRALAPISVCMHMRVAGDRVRGC